MANVRFPPIADFSGLWDAGVMLNFCCDEMRSKGRDHYKGVPESEMPDALVELHPAAGAAMLLTPSGRFDCFIQFCPWCGTRIGKEAQELVRSGFNPFE